MKSSSSSINKQKGFNIIKKKSLNNYIKLFEKILILLFRLLTLKENNNIKDLNIIISNNISNSALKVFNSYSNTLNNINVADRNINYINNYSFNIDSYNISYLIIYLFDMLLNIIREEYTDGKILYIFNFYYIFYNIY